MTPKRPVRIGGASGGFTDRVRAIRSLAENPDVDVIVGDWMSEMTMTMHGAGKQRRLAQADTLSWEQKLEQAMFCENFLGCFEAAMDALARRRGSLKLVVDAGGSDTELLAQVVRRRLQEGGHHDVRVAWIEGDDVTDVVRGAAGGETSGAFPSLATGKTLAEWGLAPVAAQCYLGGLGIARALAAGADVVVCGRVSDASTTLGAAAWWHGWPADDYDALAGALIVGHLLECSTYLSGGNCSDFRAIRAAGKHLDMGFPIGAVDHRGQGVLTKEPGRGGVITVASCTSQLLYEIQGPLYHNSDVTADLQGVQMEQLGPDEVRVSGVRGLPPPATTKVGITGCAGYQAELHVYLCGLDIEEKCKYTEEQILDEMGPELVAQFDTLKFMQNGSAPLDARNQDVATVDFRIFAQAKDRALLDMRNPRGFFRLSMATFLQSCPGATLGNDMRQAQGKPYFEYHPSLLPQSSVRQRAHLLGPDESSTILDIPPPPVFGTHAGQPSYETVDPVALDSFGPTVRLPLGRVVLGRSGDKGSDCNVGFFVRHDDEFHWLRSLLTVARLRALLGPAEDVGRPIDRCEFPGLRAVHFLLHDHLDRGYDACSTYDTLGKNCVEYLRAKTVDIPQRFVDRGTL